MVGLPVAAAPPLSAVLNIGPYALAPMRLLLLLLLLLLLVLDNAERLLA